MHTNLPLSEFILSTRFVLQSTYFHFNNKFYKQTFGTPMGFPLFPVVADLMLQKLKSIILNNLIYKPIFYYRYVDDIALSVPLSQLNRLLDEFNSFHSRLNFTMEVGGRGKRLNFLDLTIIRNDNGLIFDWFCKPTFSGRFLNYHSHHPYIHKRGTMYSSIDRVILLSHPEFHKSNFDFIINVLLDNGYPLDLIFFSIRRRLQTRSHLNSQKCNVRSNKKKYHPTHISPSYTFLAFQKNSCNFLRHFILQIGLLLLQQIK